MDPTTNSLPLRDIHLPESISWWPLAPGWWITIGLFLLAALAVYVIKQIKDRQQLSQQSMQVFEECINRYKNDGNVNALLVEMSQLLRRVSITQYEPTEVAALTGKDWLAFLDKALENHKNEQALSFRGELGEFLVAGQYQKLRSVDEKKLDQLLVLCKAWLVAACQQNTRQNRSTAFFQFSRGEN